MLELFEQALLCSGMGLALAVGLLVVFGHRLRRAHWVLSILTAASIAAAAWWVARAFGPHALTLTPVVAVSIALAALIAFAFPRWNPLGHSVFLGILVAAATFLVYAAHVVLSASLGSWNIVVGLLFLCIQGLALAMMAANTFEIVDAVCRVRWSRLGTPMPIAGYTPKVSLHVPTYDEPPDLVMETLTRLAQLDYPDYEVLVIDNNTEDEKRWRPVERYCRKLGLRFRFFHLRPWPGYKAGALNFALAHTDPEAEIVGVVDADYCVEPDYLSDLVGHFRDPDMGFLQTPQDYHDPPHRGRFGRALYCAYQYFFTVSMMSRNEYNGIIFAGTMGLIRRSALSEVGGWSEWCITEDAELSLRLLDAGYTSLYVDRTYGRGLMPLDYAGLKRQRFRWAFGGMQLLRMHARRLFWPWGHGHLTLAQRLAYIGGGLQWLSDPLTLVFALFLLAGSTALYLGASFQVQPLVGAALLMPALFLTVSAVRFIWALRVRTGCSWRDASDGMTVLLGLTWVTSQACMRGLVCRNGVFLRTPKQGKRLTFVGATRVASSELVVGGMCLIAALLLATDVRWFDGWGRLVVIYLLVWQAIVYLSAVQTSLWSFLEATPPAPSSCAIAAALAGPRSKLFEGSPWPVAVTATSHQKSATNPRVAWVLRNSVSSVAKKRASRSTPR